MLIAGAVVCRHVKVGEPFITHPVEVTRILAELKMDHESLVAGLLHDTVEDTENVKFEEIEVRGASAWSLVPCAFVQWQQCASDSDSPDTAHRMSRSARSTVWWPCQCQVSEVAFEVLLQSMGTLWSHLVH